MCISTRLTDHFYVGLLQDFAVCSLFRGLDRYITGKQSRQQYGHPGNMTQRPFHMSDDFDNDDESSLALKTRSKTKRPPLYKVMVLNDDYTPMEFVVHILERFFGMNSAKAFDIMLTVHKKGLAVVGVFSHEIAETKVTQVMDFARRHEHPLQCTMEKE